MTELKPCPFCCEKPDDCFVALKSDSKGYESGSEIYRTIEECQKKCDRLNKEKENES